MRRRIVPFALFGAALLVSVGAAWAMLSGAEDTSKLRANLEDPKVDVGENSVAEDDDRTTSEKEATSEETKKSDKPSKAERAAKADKPSKTERQAARRANGGGKPSKAGRAERKSAGGTGGRAVRGGKGDGSTRQASGGRSNGASRGVPGSYYAVPAGTASQTTEEASSSPVSPEGTLDISAQEPGAAGAPTSPVPGGVTSPQAPTEEEPPPTGTVPTEPTSPEEDADDGTPGPGTGDTPGTAPGIPTSPGDSNEEDTPEPATGGEPATGEDPDGATDQQYDSNTGDEGEPTTPTG